MGRVADSQEVYLPALCVWREMRSETETGRLACYWTIRNRASDPHGRWPRTLSAVVLQPGAFSSFNANDPNVHLMPHIGGPDYLAWLEICEMLENPAPDPTSGAVYYEALPPQQPKAPWFNPSRISLIVGKTHFYRG